MKDFFQTQWQLRPWWMNLIFIFCVYMTFIYMPFDVFFKPVAEDEEVWFGYVLRGWPAKLTEPLHWLIYGYGAYGFWKMRSWMWPWASVYLAQICIGMLVWSLIDPRGGGLVRGLVVMLVFMIPTIAMWRARAAFQGGDEA